MTKFRSKLKITFALFVLLALAVVGDRILLTNRPSQVTSHESDSMLLMARLVGTGSPETPDQTLDYVGFLIKDLDSFSREVWVVNEVGRELDRLSDSIFDVAWDRLRKPAENYQILETKVSAPHSNTYGVIRLPMNEFFVYVKTNSPDSSAKSTTQKKLNILATGVWVVLLSLGGTMILSRLISPRLQS